MCLLQNLNGCFVMTMLKIVPEYFAPLAMHSISYRMYLILLVSELRERFGRS